MGIWKQIPDLYGVNNVVIEIKKSMRISHDALDDDIKRNIDTCKLDLNIAGVYGKDDDKLIVKACELYTKWQHDYQGKGEQFEKAYRNLKDALALCGDYNVRPTD